MTGRLYVIGVGPGDPELLTLKGARILGTVGCVCVPRGKEEGTSLALSIREEGSQSRGQGDRGGLFPHEKGGPLPGDDLDSQWAGTAAALLERLDKGIDTAFVALRRSWSLQHPFFYVCERLLTARPELLVGWSPAFLRSMPPRRLHEFPLGSVMRGLPSCPRPACR